MAKEPTVIYPKLNPAAKRKWIAALTSGKYQQATGQLYKDKNSLDPDKPPSRRNRVGYCCLGVFGECVMKLPVKTEINEWMELPREEFAEFFVNGANVSAVDDVQNKLADMNDDGGKTFRQIAQWIDKNL